MVELNEQGQKLLTLLVSYLPKALPGKPETFISYKRAHELLGLAQQGADWGVSLKRQGLVSLAHWTVAEELPAITGLIVNAETRMPGKGYFTLFGKTETEFSWWEDQIRRSKTFDWSPFLPAVTLPPTPCSPDMAEPPERIETTVYRILRDTQLSRQVKHLHGHKCQLCGTAINLPEGRFYAEAHHIQPLGGPHNGPDVLENLLCLCPNHHAEFDYGVRPLDLKALRQAPGHRVGDQYAVYHNQVIHKPTPR